MTIKFIHIRNHDDQFIVTGKGGRTIAFEVQPDPTDEHREIVRFAVAKCSSRENFNRRVGRIVSAGRLIHNKSHSFGIVRGTAQLYDNIIDEADNV